MKKVFLSLVLMLMASFVRADDGNVSLVVWMKNGTQAIYELQQRPLVTFEGTDVVITGDGIEAKFPIADLVRFTYLNIPDGIIDTKADNEQVKFASDQLIITQLKVGSVVNIYTIDGRLVQSRTKPDGGTLRLPLSTFRTGVYIVKVNGSKTFKIARK
ncbi:MAG: T9SS type A sorting domain-containing protein [Bacteroidaceae bacterium]|nr:T9SS type A sorting domain-containing protein [Bacteroidaceae bacterium]